MEDYNPEQSIDFNDELRRELANWNKAIRINPNDANTYKQRADVRSQLEDYQGAFEDYTQAIRINPNDASAYSMRSYERRNLGDYKGAIEDCTKAIDLNPNDAYEYNYRAELYYFQGEYKEALEDSDRAIQLNPHYPFAYYQRGLIRNELGDYEGAIEEYKQALQLNYEDFRFYGWRGQLAYLLYIDLGDARANLGDDQGAIEDYNKVFEIKCYLQIYDRVYNKRGNARYKLGDLEGAIEDYNQAIRFDSEDAAYYINRGNVYKDLKNYQKAVEDYNHAIKIVDNYPDVYEYRGIARYYLCDKTGAIEDLKKAAALYKEGGWIEYYQEALNLIQSLSVTSNANIEDIKEIPEAFNGRPTAVKTTYNYTPKQPILNTLLEDTYKENGQVISEKIDRTHLVEIKKLVGGQELIEADGFFTPKSIKQARERITVCIARRQGQPQFRQSLLEAYNYRCAITGYDAQEALEAAHIIPYIETENNHPSNGLLLRADIHTLFDLNLIAINPETMRVHLAPSLRRTSYGEMDGKSLQLPKISAYLPNKEALKSRCNQCEWYR
ncbi:tetratricopeptide repeat protein [Iningainema tapete]|uniref:Tetratricopeptide repeat protein n=1 Tax=Iningainema tapete BLCC-T55 TaxID=2748662 RepID=A0A8J6XZ68_9CYAN|nr:tetratricopeptide repeat protein [Iningainema tapete]MBD2778702.1 tetratricopeptide repeat protein [Iningainema tapete BLCC-T55]